MSVLFFSVLLQDYWVSELASDSIHRREDAMNRLIAGGVDALPRLRAEKGGDVEMTVRLDIIVRTLEKPARYGLGCPGAQITWYGEGEDGDSILLLLRGDGLILVHRGKDGRRPYRPTAGGHRGILVRPLFRLAMDLDLLDSASVVSDGLELYSESYHQYPERWSLEYESASGEVREWYGSGDPPPDLAKLILHLRRAALSIETPK